MNVEVSASVCCSWEAVRMTAENGDGTDEDDEAGEDGEDGEGDGAVGWGIAESMRTSGCREGRGTSVAVPIIRVRLT
ncbi:hypothetical protein GCM10018785_29840 [Streptomyces longispororuber]|uniref:Uncharacterized protein n=1 Tax=Streptomyces longispororuber TaxID=68230 RepID=A0A919DN11_9ACTN|nr:hypothetical protein GCM10018785_29840 [Streptomyces longispororuber]